MATSTIKPDNNSFRNVNFASINGTLEAGGIWNSGSLWVINARIKLTQNIASGDTIATLPQATSGYSSYVALASSNNVNYRVIHANISADTALSSGDVVIISGVIVI